MTFDHLLVEVVLVLCPAYQTEMTIYTSTLSLKREVLGKCLARYYCIMQLLGPRSATFRRGGPSLQLSGLDINTSNPLTINRSVSAYAPAGNTLACRGLYQRPT